MKVNMKYSNLEFKTVVDWIEFEIRTIAKTQAAAIHKKAGSGVNLSVFGCDEHTKIPFPRSMGNTSTTLFRLRIQEPKCFHTVKEWLQQVSRNFPLKSAPNTTAIEVAFDTYCIGASLRHLAEIAADRYRFSTCIPGCDWYFYRKKGEGRQYISTPDMATRKAIGQHFEAGWQLTEANDKGVDVRYHAYVKAHDDGNALPKREWRARFEVTLQGAALPCMTIDELERIDFVQLAERFKFRRLSDALHPAAKYALTQWSGKQLGRRGKYRRSNQAIIGKHSGSSVFRGSTVADEQLNAMVYGCLRKLTRTWRNKRPRADFPSDFAKQTCANPHEYWDDGERSNNSLNNYYPYIQQNSTADNIYEGAALRTSLLTDDNEQSTAAPSPESALQIRHDHIQAASVESRFPELFNPTPELEAEQKRINRLMEYDEIAPPPIEAKS
jgi:hypothetical protein